MRVVRIVFRDDNWLEGSVIEENESFLMIQDSLYGFCRVEKEDLIIEEVQLVD